MSFKETLTFIIELLAGAGVFLVGVKLLSNNIEKLATKRIKSLFSKTAKSKFINIGIGAVSTALVQSSGVVTVLIVGFVNVGLMSLYQATAMIMGANIGTTLTAQIAALSAFNFTKYIQCISFIGIFVAMISKKDSVKRIGYIVAGFGLIFIGLSLMSSSMNVVKEQASDLFQVVTKPFLLFFIGIALTALVQSSAAVTSIIISIAVAGLTIGNGGNSVLFIILGTNIGSCVTALISSIGASQNAKRASLIHLMFNCFGSIIFFIILIAWPSFMENTFGRWFEESATQIAMFHTFFNVICTIVFLPLTNVFVKIAKFVIKDKKEEVEVSYLDDRMIHTTAVAIDLATKESMRLSDVAMDAFNIGYNCFYNRTTDGLDDAQEKIEKANNLNKTITDYIVKVSALSTVQEEKLISDLYNNIGDIMRAAEIADNFIKYTNREIAYNLIFSEFVKGQLNEMVAKVNELHVLVKQIILTKDGSLIPKVDEVEEQIDAYRKMLLDGHIERLNKGECKPESSSVFINLVSNLERLGDHFTYIAYTVK